MRIAFGYKARSGKDTASDYLIQKYGGCKLSFAGSIYKIACKAQKIACFPQEKDRELLQFLGSWGRKRDPDTWINIVKESILLNSTYNNIFISDVRFNNEFDMLKKQDFLLVKIVRREIESDAGSHPSEVELDSVEDDKWDAVIYNNGNIEDFYKKLDLMTKNFNTHM